MTITTHLGVVLEFDKDSAKGIILSEGKKIKFHSTIFQSLPPTKFPEVYDLVRLSYDEDRLISVRQYKNQD